MASGDAVPKRMGGPTQLGIATTSIVASPTSGHQFTIKQVIINNISGIDRWFTISIGAVATTNTLMYRLPIAAYDTIIWDTALVLEYGETLQGLADAASAVTVTCTGWDREN